MKIRTATDAQIRTAIAEKQAIVDAAPGYSMSTSVRIAENELESLLHEALDRGLIG